MIGKTGSGAADEQGAITYPPTIPRYAKYNKGDVKDVFDLTFESILLLMEGSAVQRVGGRFIYYSSDGGGCRATHDMCCASQ